MDRTLDVAQSSMTNLHICSFDLCFACFIHFKPLGTQTMVAVKEEVRMLNDTMSKMPFNHLVKNIDPTDQNVKSFLTK
jgi:hypothetical protein